MSVRLGVSLLAIVCTATTAACERAKTSGEKVAEKNPRQSPPTGAAGPAQPADLAAEASKVRAELASYSERRKVKPAVIGGCNEACESPRQAIGLLFDALAARDRVARVAALQPLFEWSLLQVDGVSKGPRWSQQWMDLGERAARQAEIAAWLAQWSGWVERIEGKDALLAARMNGVKLRPIAGRDDVVEVAFAHPRLRNDKTAPVWRLQWTRRGYEWLISRIDHNPGRHGLSKRSKSKRSKNALQAPPRGSPSPGRL